MGASGHRRVALVTGGGRGIGLETARLLAARGAALVIADLDVECGERAAKELGARGGEALFVRADVADEASVVALLDAVFERFGRLDAAFNNAGISDAQHSWVDFPTERWRRMIEVNLGSVFLCLKHELGRMSEQEAIEGLRGQIVNTASGAALTPAPGQPHYTAAKHAVLGLTRSAAQEFARQGIRVNAICPGLTDTALIQSQPQPFLEMMARLSPSGELAKPVDVAQAAAWLLSPEAHWVNGQTLVVDGGQLFH